MILRPAIPPWSLTILLKKAISSRPLELYEDAGPLYGLVWPILISVAVTPVVSPADAPCIVAIVAASPATAAVPMCTSGNAVDAAAIRTAFRRVILRDIVMTYTPCAAALNRSRAFIVGSSRARPASKPPVAGQSRRRTNGPPQECNLTIGKNGIEGQKNQESAAIYSKLSLHGSSCGGPHAPFACVQGRLSG